MLKQLPGGFQLIVDIPSGTHPLFGTSSIFRDNDSGLISKRNYKAIAYVDATVKITKSDRVVYSSVDRVLFRLGLLNRPSTNQYSGSLSLSDTFYKIWKENVTELSICTNIPSSDRGKCDTIDFRYDMVFRH